MSSISTYMEFRNVTLTFLPPTKVKGKEEEEGEPLGFDVRDIDIGLHAWMVQCDYDPTDSHFSSSNSTIDAVWELCRYTLQAGVLDIFTDSNTRECRPYDADDLIAATGRQMLQRDFIEKSTWPVEWQQMMGKSRVVGL